jgi:hypothetical protein
MHPRWLQKTYHAAGGGCRNRACQIRSWSFEEAGLDLETGGRLDRLHIRAHLWWVSRWIRQLLVVTGSRCPLTKPVVTAVELQATIKPHCSRGVQPGGICVCVVQREPAPRVRGRACAQAASASYASCCSGSVFCVGPANCQAVGSEQHLCAKRGSPSETSETWACSVCTLVNDKPLAPVCEACGSRRLF